MILVIRRIYVDSRAWSHGLTFPFYVPPAFMGIRSLLSEGRVVAATIELSKLTALGSGDAAATLSYMRLRGPCITGAEGGSSTCNVASARANGFAQYVVACVEYQRGNFKEYARWLHRASRQSFPPAIGDFGRALIVAPTNRLKWSIPLAKRVFWRAIAHGHLPSIIYFLRACNQRKFGWGYYILSIFALPPAIIVIVAAIRLFPFCKETFSYPYGTKKPLFDRVESTSS